MNVILLERINNLGDLGEEVNVKSGFARNYLIPKGMAVRSTEDERKVFQERREEFETAANAKLSEAEQRAIALEDHSITIVVRTGEEGRLYGSIGTQEIATALSNGGIEVRKSEVMMPEGAIRVIGEYSVDIQLHADIVRTIQVVIAAE
jgi:large subunit ribosomal protein L9